MTKKAKYNDILHIFTYFKGFKSIPGIYSGYSINIYGEIKYRTGDIKIPIRVDEHGEWLSLRCTDGTAREFNRAVLVSMVARNISWPVAVCSKLTMYFLDDDCNNVHPSNTIVAPLSDTVEWKPGIRYIPGYSNYAITKDGKLFNILRNKELSWRKDNSTGYLKTGMFSDYNKRRTVYQHRVIMLAWSEYSADVFKLQINHKDGVKINNDFDNLEWCTVSENAIHARKTGLHNGNGLEVRVLTKHVYTNEIIEYNSLHDAAKKFNITHTSVIRRVKTDGDIIFDNHLWKLTTTTTPWNNTPTISGVITKSCMGKEIKIYSTYASVCREYNITLPAIISRCNTDGQVIFDGHLWKYADSKTDWAENPMRKRQKTRYLVQYKDEIPKEYPTHKEIATLLGVAESMISKGLKQNKIYKYNDYLIWNDK